MRPKWLAKIRAINICMPPAPAIGRVRRQVRRVRLSGLCTLNPHFSWDAGKGWSPKEMVGYECGATSKVWRSLRDQ